MKTISRVVSALFILFSSRVFALPETDPGLSYRALRLLVAHQISNDPSRLMRISEENMARLSAETVPNQDGIGRSLLLMSRRALEHVQRGNLGTYEIGLSAMRPSTLAMLGRMTGIPNEEIEKLLSDIPEDDEFVADPLDGISIRESVIREAMRDAHHLEGRRRMVTYLATSIRMILGQYISIAGNTFDGFETRWVSTAKRLTETQARNVIDAISTLLLLAEEVQLTPVPPYEVVADRDHETVTEYVFHCGQVRLGGLATMRGFLQGIYFSHGQHR